MPALGPLLLAAGLLLPLHVSAEDGRTRITAEDIARERPADLMEMLRSRVGVHEDNSVISMRGVPGIAIYVDGFESSIEELKALRPGQVASIEIFHGAASSRFGAEAMGGAIAITTRSRGVAQETRLALTQGLDSRLGRFTRLRAGRDENLGNAWSLLAERKWVHGYHTVPDSPFPYQITVEDERSDSTLVDGRVAWRDERLDLSIDVKRADEQAAFGRPAWDFGWRTDTIRARLDWRLWNHVSLEAGIGEERYRSSGTRDRGTGTDSSGLAPERRLTEQSRRRDGTLALSWDAPTWKARAGLSLTDLRERFGDADHASLTPLLGAESHIRKEAAFAATELPLGDGRLELSQRRDLQRYLSSQMFDAGATPHTATGGGTVLAATSRSLALAWPVGGYRLRGSLGTGFSPPQASQLFHGYAGAGAITLANPNLHPERSTTADLALSGGDFGLTLFATRWRDKIGTRIISPGMPSVQQPQNVGVVFSHGVEASWSRRLPHGWTIDANLTRSRSRIVRDAANPDLAGNEMPDMPRQKGNLTLTYADGDRFTARARWRGAGSSYTDEANTVRDAAGHRWKKAGYAVLDLSATWNRPLWNLTLALDNALSRDYVSGFFWHGEPRTLRGELTLNF